MRTDPTKCKHPSWQDTPLSIPHLPTQVFCSLHRTLCRGSITLGPATAGESRAQQKWTQDVTVTKEGTRGAAVEANCGRTCDPARSPTVTACAACGPATASESLPPPAATLVPPRCSPAPPAAWTLPIGLRRLAARLSSTSCLATSLRSGTVDACSLPLPLLCSRPLSLWPPAALHIPLLAFFDGSRGTPGLGVELHLCGPRVYHYGRSPNDHHRGPRI